MRYLSCDPAERTYAYSVTDIEIKKGKLQVRLIESHYIEHTIVNLTHNDRYRIGKFLHDPLEVELPLFSTTCDRLLSHKPARLGVERYQARGFKGKGVESINMMNGILLGKADAAGVRYTLYTAAVWKFWVNQRTPLEGLYKVGNIRGLQPHTVDTVCTALWLFSGDNPQHKDLFTAALLAGTIRAVKLSKAKP